MRDGVYGKFKNKVPLKMNFPLGIYYQVTRQQPVRIKFKYFNRETYLNHNHLYHEAS